jgi:hypothetical protein
MSLPSCAPAPDVGLVIGEDLDTAKKNVANAWTKAQVVTPVVLADAATIAIDASLSNKFQVTLGGNRQFGNPTNMLAGQTIAIPVDQDSTSRAHLRSMWKPRNGTAPTFSTAPNASDIVTGVYWTNRGEIPYTFAENF